MHCSSFENRKLLSAYAVWSPPHAYLSTACCAIRVYLSSGIAIRAYAILAWTRKDAREHAISTFKHEP
eukprot:3940748-Rhodomonas_salina.1